jgi:uncharacterized protein (TIGR00369 family)
MSTPEASLQPNLSSKAKANDMPAGRLIGFETKEAADGRAVSLAAGSQHANPMGTLHGGILCDIADAAMGVAFASTLAPDESFTTIELKINFFRPVWESVLKTEGKVVRRGEQSRICRARNRRRKRPPGCQGGLDLPGFKNRAREGALHQGF